MIRLKEFIKSLRVFTGLFIVTAVFNAVVLNDSFLTSFASDVLEFIALFEN